MSNDISSVTIICKRCGEVDSTPPEVYILSRSATYLDIYAATILVKDDPRITVYISTLHGPDDLIIQLANDVNFKRPYFIKILEGGKII